MDIPNQTVSIDKLLSGALCAIKGEVVGLWSSSFSGTASELSRTFSTKSFTIVSCWAKALYTPYCCHNCFMSDLSILL